jgi:two-component system, cell cycle response regulator DivK
MRVLYVEDNPANVFLVKRVAKMGNHEIVNFVDGTEALARYKAINPDLVLMDIQISGELNGLDVVKRLRSDGVDTPIIAVTAYAMVGDRERCIEAGCTDYMAKPLPIPQLVQIFEHYSQHTSKKLDTSERLAVSVLDEPPSLVTKETPMVALEPKPAPSVPPIPEPKLASLSAPNAESKPTSDVPTKTAPVVSEKVTEEAPVILSEVEAKPVAKAEDTTDKPVTA